jgi:phage-related minor tail protein
MSNRIKGITVEIGGDTTKLSKALEGVNKNIKNTQTQLKDVQKLLKLDPSNTELLSQKHKLLADAVTATKEKLETLKTAAEQANTALANGDISQEELNAAKESVCSHMRTVTDSAGAIEEFYSIENLSGCPMTPEAYIQQIEKITIDDVVAAAKTLKLHTVYTLEGVSQ